MTCSKNQWWMIAPLMVSSMAVCADTASIAFESSDDPFSFNTGELDSIQFSRSSSAGDALELSGSRGGAQALIDREAERANYFSLSRQTEFSFSLKPKLPDFSREGAYGLDLFDAPKLDVQSYLIGSYGFGPYASALHDGLEYSAGVRLDQDQEDDTAYVSSSLLGLSYGRLGRLWYGGVDVNLEQFSSNEQGHESSDILSLDVTTGRRFGITGLDSDSPLWMLSLQANLDVDQWELNDDLDASSDWFINPSLFWQRPSFMFSAQMQLPVQFETLDDQGEPDYRLRAVFEKQFK